MLDTNIERLEITVTASGTFLYSETGSNGGIVAWRVDGGAVPNVVDSFYFPGSLASMAVLDLSWATFNGYTRIIFGVTQGGDLLTSNSAGPGDLDRQTTVRLDDAHSPWLQNGLLTAEIASGADMIYVADAISGALNGYAIDRDGIPRWVSATASPSGAASATQVLLDRVSVAGTEFLLRADGSFDGVACYAIGATGTLVQVGSLGAANGLGVNDPTAMATVSAFGKTFVLLGAGGSSTISVMELTATGSLRPTDHLLDTRDSRFGTLTVLKAVAVEGRVFVVAGGGDDGLTLFTLLPDGRLVQLQVLEQEPGLGLENITALAMTVVGSEIRLFVSSGAETGLSLLRIDLGDLGATVNGTVTGSTRRDGSAGDDLLISNSSGQDTLMGLAGEDVLVSGPGSTQMFGGDGNDLFVIRSSGNRQYVMDYTPGDRIDLSGLPMLHSTAQLTATPTSRGILLTYFGIEIEIVSSTGQPLSLGDIWSGLGFGLPDRVIVLGELDGERLQAGQSGGVLEGTIGRDTLLGGRGNDTIHGLGSSDQIRGGEGRDVIEGDGGNDTIFGDAGNDFLDGGDGANKLDGGNGNDTLIGGMDGDLLNGWFNADSLVGNAGDDTIYGSSGADTVLAGAGNDRISGGRDADSIAAGEGDDRVNGSLGNDTILGEAGNDTIKGGAGDDRIADSDGANLINAGAGADTVLAGPGNDTIIGGAESGLDPDLADSLSGGGGNDRIWGGAGADTLRGDSSNDTLRGGSAGDLIDGGSGNDWLYGDAGDDTLIGGPGSDLFLHDGRTVSGTDWITDGMAEDRFVFLRPSASIADIGLRWVDLGGDGDVRDVQIIYRPTGMAIWTVIDAESLQRLALQIGTETHYLLV
ncbi:calcium-binding protein [Rhodobacter viridis]|uniref:calcium-binding protein n=1 Tax=Rhodobacter viridis TaxID=1054202 RepID=UPI0015E88C7A|nr:calcium-binding protein [Rhodobacter viridis]